MSIWRTTNTRLWEIGASSHPEDQSRRSRYSSNRWSAKEPFRWYCDGCSHGITKIPDRDRTQRSVASHLAASYTLKRRLVPDADFLTKHDQMRSRRLSLVRKTWPMAALSLLLPSAAVRAQTSMTAFPVKAASAVALEPSSH